MGLVITPLCVRTSATLTRLSDPWYTFVTLPSLQQLGGRFSSRTTTRVFSVTLISGDFHLCRFWSSFKYSFFHLAQKCWWIALSLCHRFRIDIGSSWISGSNGNKIGVPIKKWPGVNAVKSDGLCDIEDIGLELRQASIRDNKVWNSSNVYLVDPATFLKCCLKLFTPASHKPPICGAPGGMKCQVMFWWE